MAGSALGFRLGAIGVKKKRSTKKTSNVEVTPGPVVPRTAVAQTKSRRLLEDALEPWLVTRWEQHDYGIDAVVEIVTAIHRTTNHDPSGKFLSVQLKSTDSATLPTSIDVTTGHLRYWLRHSMPVLLVSAHLPTRSLRGRWIDETLVTGLKQRTPQIWAQKSVAIGLGDGFSINASSHREIETHVARFHARATALTPNKFFELQKRLIRSADALLRAGERTGLESVRLIVERTRTGLRTAAYMVAITGPQRVGKSTLINALLRTDISPVAAFPTTAVPLVFGAGDAPTARVSFVDGTASEVSATVEALRPFAAQQVTNRSDRQVRLVSVTLPNDALARGIEIVDTPGLHDASAAVREVTEIALKSADAVLFVLDAGLDMKFKLSAHDIEDLTRLQAKKEHLIVLLNQSDLLAADRREAVAAYVRTELAKYGLEQGLACPPLFVSGRDAWRAHIEGKSPPPEFRGLEDALWGHLLRTRRTGLHRLQDAVGVLEGAAQEIASLAAERQTRGKEAADIDAARRTCANAISKAHKLASETLAEDVAFLRHLLADEAHDSKQEWKNRLDQIPNGQDLPSADSAQQQLLAHVDLSRSLVWEARGHCLQVLAERLNELVRDALADARVSLGMPPIVSMQDIHLPPLPALDLSLPETYVGLLSGAVFFLLHPVLGALTTLVGWAIGHDVAVAKRRARTMKRLIESYETAIDEAYAVLARQIVERYMAGANALSQQVKGRLDTFIADAERRVERLGRTMSRNEKTRLGKARAVANEERARLRQLAEELAILMYEKAD
jgi:signal recognition particle receptor subunit beta